MDVETRSQLLEGLNALEKTRLLALASITLYCYEYMMTFSREYKFYWSGPWTTSRVLFLANRYFPLVIMTLSLVCLFAPDLSLNFCTRAIRGLFILNLLAMTLIQAIIVLRIWHLYVNKRRGRVAVLCCYIACTIATFSLLGTVWHEIYSVAFVIPGIASLGCSAPPSQHVWRIFVPNLVLHTVLYGATTLPALRAQRIGKPSPIMDRILRDGGLFYLVVFASVGFSSIGGAQQNPIISVPAIYANFALSTTSISVSRLLLSIQNLASNLAVNPKWLLNNAELSCVKWRRGSNEGELIVEIDTVEAVDEVDDPKFGGCNAGVGGDTITRPITPRVHTTQVGVYGEMGNSWL